MSLIPHKSILVDECLAAFQGKTIRYFVDGTLGAGGHAAAFLEAHPEIERFIGIDQDPLALEIATQRLHPFAPKITLLHGNFRHLRDYLTKCHISQVDGILLDLGVSSMQLDRKERGLSFSKEGPLDMRMDTTATLTARDILMHWSEQKLGQLFRDFGEEPKWRQAAKCIVAARATVPLLTTTDLVELLTPLFPWNPRKKIHPLTLIFQALRIAVNSELAALQEALPQAVACLAPAGRLAILSFHSLEDRIVKQYFRSISGYPGGRSQEELHLEQEPPIAHIPYRKAIAPSAEEIAANPRSRSAKLRVLEKLY